MSKNGNSDASLRWSSTVIIVVEELSMKFIYSFALIALFFTQDAFASRNRCWTYSCTGQKYVHVGGWNTNWKKLDVAAEAMRKCNREDDKIRQLLSQSPGGITLEYQTEDGGTVSIHLKRCRACAGYTCDTVGFMAN